MERKNTSEAENSGKSPEAGTDRADAAGSKEPCKKNGGWQEIEARREKAALKAELADVWDEDFDLDEEILADLDHKAEFFTAQNDIEDVVIDEDDDAGEFFEDDEV